MQPKRLVIEEAGRQHSAIVPQTGDFELEDGALTFLRANAGRAAEWRSPEHRGDEQTHSARGSPGAVRRVSVLVAHDVGVPHSASADLNVVETAAWEALQLLRQLVARSLADPQLTD
ncbi:hypothetical protein [Sandaracinus amylolyticus]|uniref:hypothetical protein n=1 Tax=Sandaracinus amylolyticus TaxID=927083 RepID=UPI001F3C25FF|nr:hypothetical protein [Sandaracinus amylolyticus]